jgi:REP element-mobilizing transposase RayT
MPRPPRIDFPDAVYHVTSRGNGRTDIFSSDEDRERFLAQLAHHLQQCGVVLQAFVLMQNHFHLLCRTPRANLSRFMQRLLSSYALYWRHKHRRPGHLFQGRFKAKLVEEDTYLLAVTRYLHLNPVKIAVCRRMSRQDRLARLAAYRWSSYGGYAAAAKALEFVNYDVLNAYGRDLAGARRHYRAYVQACLTEDDEPLLEAMAASRYAIGATPFIGRTEERITERHTGLAQDRDLDLPRTTVSLEEIDAAVARHYRIDPGTLSAHGRSVGPAKGVAVELAAQLADMSSRAIGAHYGMGATAVPANHHRLMARHELLKVVETLSARLRKKNRKC